MSRESLLIKQYKGTTLRVWNTAHTFLVDVPSSKNGMMVPGTVIGGTFHDN